MTLFPDTGISTTGLKSNDLIDLLRILKAEKILENQQS